jgi:hypothetical protein
MRVARLRASPGTAGKRGLLYFYLPIRRWGAPSVAAAFIIKKIMASILIISEF